MNKNSRARRREALRNFHVHKMPSTTFEVFRMMKGNTLTKIKQSIPIGYVKPPEKPKKVLREVDSPEGEDAKLAQDRLEPKLRDKKAPAPVKVLKEKK